MYTPELGSPIEKWKRSPEDLLAMEPPKLDHTRFILFRHTTLFAR